MIGANDDFPDSHHLAYRVVDLDRDSVTDSDAFLRISSMTTAANVKNPLVTFGNDASKAFIVEATPHIVDLEKDILKLTSYLYHLGEVVLKRALNIVKEILVQKEVKNSVGDGKGGHGSTPNKIN